MTCHLSWPWWWGPIKLSGIRWTCTSWRCTTSTACWLFFFSILAFINTTNYQQKSRQIQQWNEKSQKDWNTLMPGKKWVTLHFFGAARNVWPILSMKTGLWTRRKNPLMKIIFSGSGEDLAIQDFPGLGPSQNFAFTFSYSSRMHMQLCGCSDPHNYLGWFGLELWLGKIVLRCWCLCTVCNSSCHSWFGAVSRPYYSGELPAPGDQGSWVEESWRRNSGNTQDNSRLNEWCLVRPVKLL